MFEKKRLKNFLLGIIVILIAALIIYSFTKDKDTTPQEFIKDISCKEQCQENEICIMLCENADIIDEAVNKANPEICDQLNQPDSDFCKDSFYTQIAIIEDNVELCSEILWADMMDECFDYYYLNKAKLTSNLEFCAQINNLEIQKGCENL